MGESTETVANIFSTLADPVRRYVLNHLAENETPASFDRLAAQVGAWHTDSGPNTVGDAALTEMRMALYHMHLPKLVEAGYIEWNKDTHTIGQGPNFDDIAPVLRLMAEHEDELPTGWL